MTLDLSTVYVFAIVLQIGVVAARICVQIFSKTYPGFTQWTMASVIQVIGFSLLAARQGDQPNLPMALAFVALFLIWPLHLDGMLRFLNPERRGLRWLNAAFALVWIGGYEAIYWLGVARPSLLAIQATGLLIFAAAALALVLSNLLRGRFTSLWLLVFCIIGSMSHHGLRLVGALTDGKLHEAMTSELGFAWVGITATLLTILVAVAQFCLNAQRVTQDLELKSQDLERIASIDALTGLMTRRRFVEEGALALDFARRHGRPVSFLMCDLDHFKSINDRFGHVMGDTVLSAAGAVLRDAHRAGDRVGRLGGEEFGLLLAESDLKSATAAAERLRLAIADMPGFDRGPDAVTISIGVAAFDPESDDLTSLMARADRALYRAKNAGRNCWFVSEEAR